LVCWSVGALGGCGPGTKRTPKEYCAIDPALVKPGYKTQFSQVYSSDDPNLDTDVQFAVTHKLVGTYVLHENAPAPDGEVASPWYSLDYTFTIEPGASNLPRAPITGKASGPRPTLEVLKRT
jgi:catechol 1,2-dioxygenase